MEKYKKISFIGMVGFCFPNPILNYLRDKVIKFQRNNTITREEHLRKFIGMLNDYEVEHKDFIMKLFFHSLTKDARDWFTRFPNDSIGSWDDLENIFKD